MTPLGLGGLGCGWWLVTPQGRWQREQREEAFQAELELEMEMEKKLT